MSERSTPHAPAPRAAWVDRVRIGGLILLGLAVAVVVPQLVAPQDDDSGRAPVGAVQAQRVVAWTLHEEGGETYIGVFAAGGRDPVVVAIPARVTINLPGQNLGSLADAAAAGDPALLELALENLLTVPVDETVLEPLASIAGVVDGVGGIEVRGRPASGDETTSYLRDIPAEAPVDLAFLRWQDVLDGLIQAGPRRPEGLPDALRRVLPHPDPAFLSLPVVDIGGGLLRPDEDAIGALVSQHFVRTTRDEVRLVVLNGVGTPGVGKDVARILVPEGFRLVSSGNANTFDLEVTQIIASSRGDLEAAEYARTLLGAGEISVGNQPSGLADVTVVVGRDFGGS